MNPPVLSLPMFPGSRDCKVSGAVFFSLPFQGFYAKFSLTGVKNNFPNK